MAPSVDEIKAGVYIPDSLVWSTRSSAIVEERY